MMKKEDKAKICDAQVLACLSAVGKKVGLVINFNVPLIKKGIKRIVL
jgi:hypothetical protein